MTISFERGISPENAEKIAAWTNACSEAFLRQWAGDKWSFPLLAEQILSEQERVSSLFASGTFVGMIQELLKQEDNYHIGRFIIDPEMRGKGLGQSALMLFTAQLFKKHGDVKSITMNVMKHNKGARLCYEKCGFVCVGENIVNGASESFKMKLERN